MTEFHIAKLFCSYDTSKIIRVFEYYADKGVEERHRLAADILWLDYDMYPYLIDYVAFAKIPSFEVLEDMSKPVKEGYICDKEISLISIESEPLPFYLKGLANTLEYIATHSESMVDYDFSTFKKLSELTIYGDFVPESVNTIPNLKTLYINTNNPETFKTEQLCVDKKIDKIVIDNCAHKEGSGYGNNSLQLINFINTLPKVNHLTLINLVLDDLKFENFPEILELANCKGSFDMSIYNEDVRINCNWKVFGGDVEVIGAWYK